MFIKIFLNACAIEIRFLYAYTSIDILITNGNRQNKNSRIKKMNRTIVISGVVMTILYHKFRTIREEDLNFFRRSKC